MAHYLVTAKPIKSKLDKLKEELEKGAFLPLSPFGQEVTKALTNARLRDKDTAIWEEEDYCIPPLAQEREVVFDEYFDDIEVETVQRGEGWGKIKEFPYLLDDIKRTD